MGRNFLKIFEYLDERLRRRITEAQKLSEEERKYNEAVAKLKADPKSIPKVVDTDVAKLVLKMSLMNSRTQKLNYLYSQLAKGKTPLDAKMNDQKRYRQVMKACNFDTARTEKRKSLYYYLLYSKLSEIIQSDKYGLMD